MSKVIKQMELDALDNTFKGVRDMVLLSSSKVGGSPRIHHSQDLAQKKIRLQMVKNSSGAQGIRKSGRQARGKTLGGQRHWSPGAPTASRN